MVCRWIFFTLVEEVGTRESKGNYVKEGRRVRSTITEGDETIAREGEEKEGEGRGHMVGEGGKRPRETQEEVD